MNAGFIFYLFIDKNTALHKHVITCLVTGLVLLTTIAQIIVLFAPVNINVSIAVSLCLLLGLIRRNIYKDFLVKIKDSIISLHPITKIGIVTTYILLLLLNAGPTLMDDTESYHIQMIKWVNEYGTVTGIANLHERFGFNSSWFSSVALFSFSSAYNYYTVLNGTIAIWLSTYLWVSANRVYDKTAGQNSCRDVISLMILGMLLFLWPLIRGNVSTANYDYISTVIIVLLFFDLLKSNHQESFLIEWFLWPVYLFTVRIINYPLLLMSLFSLYFLIKQKNLKIIIISAALCLLLIVPFLVRNSLLSGYPFFPSPYFDVFIFDWKVDKKVINDLLYFIKYFNRVNDIYQSTRVTAALHFPAWITAWFKYLFLYDKVLIIPGLTGFLILSFAWRRIASKNIFFKVLLATIIFQLISWFFIAPDPRFVYGPLLCGVALLLYAFLKPFSYLKLKTVNTIGAFVLITFSIALSFSKLIRDPRYQNILVSYKLPQPSLQKVKVDNIELNIPERVLSNWNPRCYASKLPCLYKVNPRLHLRGKTIKEGFSIR